MNLIDHMFAGIGLCILFILAWKLFPLMIVLLCGACFTWLLIKIAQKHVKIFYGILFALAALSILATLALILLYTFRP
mgnify:FL=1